MMMMMMTEMAEMIMKEIIMMMFPSNDNTISTWNSAIGTILLAEE